jgi:hypothetical protein
MSTQPDPTPDERPLVERLVERVIALVDGDPSLRILVVMPPDTIVRAFGALLEALGDRVEQTYPYRSMRVKGARRWRYDSLVLTAVAGALNGCRFDVVLTDPSARTTGAAWWEHVSAHVNGTVLDV